MVVFFCNDNFMDNLMNKKQIFSFLGLMASSVLLPASAEVIPGTELSINFESGHIVGSGRHLNMTRVPVIDIDTGKTTFYDASFKFTLDPQDGLIFEQITSAAVSPPIAVANIIPGVYSSQKGYCYILEGPTALGSSRSVYTFRSILVDGCNANSSRAFSAQIVSGLAAGHPDVGERDIVSNLKDDYVYGYIATGSTDGRPEVDTAWEQNELLGVRQSGNQLIVGLFSDGVDTNDLPIDFSRPRETVILTKVNQ